jgi:hypothetical protein
VKIAGRLGVPSTGVTAVAVNVSVASVNGGGGALMAYPDGGSRSGAQQIFWSSSVGRRTALITVQVPADGVIDFYSSNAIHLTVDVEGYWANDRTGVPYLGVTGNPPHVLDTRKAIGVSITHPVGNNTALTFKVTGSLIASRVKAVVLNLTALNSTGSGYLTATAGGSARPSTVTTGWAPGSGYVNNLVYAPVNPKYGTVTVYVTGSGTTHVTADVQGYFITTGTVSFHPLAQGQAPRILDTRNAVGVTTKTPLKAGGWATIQVTNTGGSSNLAVPSGAKYVLLDVTALDTAASGGLVAYSATMPPYLDSYWQKGQVIASPVLIPLSSRGTVTIRVTGATDLLADVQGWYS